MISLEQAIRVEEQVTAALDWAQTELGFQYQATEFYFYP